MSISARRARLSKAEPRDLGPLSNAFASAAADAMAESVIAIRASARTARKAQRHVPTSPHPVERTIRMWIIQQERDRQRERRRAASAAALVRSSSDIGALARGVRSAGHR
jgi:hypothetical protein